MIGHYVDGLSRAAEDRVLTKKLIATALFKENDCYCLVGAASGFGSLLVEPSEFRREFDRATWRYNTGDFHWTVTVVGVRYDALVQRFGERLNIAIRNRILANRARRALSVPQREEVATWA